MCHVKRMKAAGSASNCGARCNVQHSSEWQIALSKYRDDGYDSLTTPLAPNAVSPTSSSCTHETKVLNKVHQCVLFTKAKRRCHNLTHTLQAHTHPLIHSPTHSHTRTCRAGHALPCQAQEESFVFMQPCCLLGLMTLQRSVSASASACACATACVCACVCAVVCVRLR